MLKILICGYGIIGKHTYNDFTNNPYFDVSVYDIVKRESDVEYVENVDGEYDIVFICVPTEGLSDGDLDISIVTELVAKIKNKAKAIVIKSAVPPMTALYLENSFNLNNIVISPEFYGSALHANNNPDFVILGGDDMVCEFVAQSYMKAKNANFKIRILDHSTAELVKFMENCYFAAIVTFVNDFKAVADLFNVSYTKLREAFLLDKRISPTHTWAYQDQPFYNSHCLLKDVPALIYSAKGKAPFIDAMHKINEMRRKSNEYNNKT